MSAAGVTLVGAAVKRPRDPGSTQTSFSLGEYYKEGQRPVSLFLLSSFTHYYSATKEEGPGQVSSRFLRFNIIHSLWTSTVSTWILNSGISTGVEAKNWATWNHTQRNPLSTRRTSRGFQAKEGNSCASLFLPSWATISLCPAACLLLGGFL